ncbi:MAG: response regulator [Chloroflexi bacterium]|nr:response regulator [Chloroflexota bacterium]
MTRIILVDDEPLVRQALPIMLRAAGYEVLPFADGGTALEFLQGEQVRMQFPNPDVVLLDLHMAPVGGLDVIQALAARRPGILPHIIVLSGFHPATVATWLTGYPIAGTLRKPLRAGSPVLFEAIETARRGAKILGSGGGR